MLNFRVLLFSFFTLIVWHSGQAEIFKWKDKQGNIHFSDKPHGNATELDIKSQKPAGIGSSKEQIKRQKALLDDFQRRREKKQKLADEHKKREKAYNSYCTRLKNQMINYQEADYLFRRNNKGEKQDLTDEQKEAEIKRLQAEIDDKC